MTNFELLWSVPSGRWQLNEANVHVWASRLNKPVDRISNLERTLSPDERARATRFHFDRDRNRFIVGRGLLRTIVGSYLDADPAQLRFAYSPRGKPHLTGASRPPKLNFNIAHSNDLILIALTRVDTIGIDVEWIDYALDFENIAGYFFTAHERETLLALPKGLRRLAFYNLWTRKEAYLKATGVGLADFDKIDVSFLPDEPVQILSVQGNPQAAERWTMLDLTPASEYKAAVVAAAKDQQFCFWEWPL
jgi:4'-phosphopantetheinyl transferase